MIAVVVGVYWVGLEAYQMYEGFKLSRAGRLFHFDS